MDDHPVTLVVSDDLHRSRLTVLFRLLLAIPHLVWLFLWSVAVAVAAVVGWLVALALGGLPAGLHRFFVSYIRYSSRLWAYLAIVANPYPAFTTAETGYPVDVRLPGPGSQPRWRTLLRLLLAIPALAVSTALGGGWFSAPARRSSGNGGSARAGALGLSGATAFLGWFAALFTGRMPSGLRDAGAFAIGYRAQVLAYLLLVTDRYPNADPTAMLADLERPPVHPVHVVGDAAALRRSRLTVLFRLPLAIPHVVWLALWTAAAVLAAVFQWLVTLVRGYPAANLHRFLCRYVRYSLHVGAFWSLAANPFPGFAGRPGTYPLDLVLPGPGRQRRWKTFFRLPLAIPAFVVASALSAALVADAVLTWFAALVTGRAPEGLRNLSAYALRYAAQLTAYLYLVTDAYPHASPLEGESPEESVEVAPALGEAA